MSRGRSTAGHHQRLPLFVVVLAVVIGTTVSVPSTRADTLVTYFNFNDQNLSSDAPGPVANSTIVPNNVTTSFVTPGSTLNVAPGDPITGTTGNFALRVTRSGTDPQYIQFTVSTLGLGTLSLSYATQRGSNGFTSQQLSYSTNGGSTFSSTGITPSSTFAPTTSFTLASFNLPSGVDQQASVIFRITLTGGNGAGANSFNDFDNIQLTAKTPEPATVAAGMLAALALCWHQRRRLSGTAQFLRSSRKPAAA